MYDRRSDKNVPLGGEYMRMVKLGLIRTTTACGVFTQDQYAQTQTGTSPDWFP